MSVPVRQIALAALLLSSSQFVSVHAADGPHDGGGGRFKSASAEPRSRPRVIVSSDFPPLDVIPVKACKPSDPQERCSDPDDVQSMVRLLLYTNDIEVEGLVASAGTFANVARKKNILDMLDRYALVADRLRARDSRYPTAQALRDKTWQGMDGAIGTETFAGGRYRPIESLIGPEHDTEASDAIIQAVDKPDPRPVWVLVWGGPREVAQAIWKVRATRSPSAADAFVRKLRLYVIAKQDYTADWLLKNEPDLFIILSEQNYMGMFWNAPGADHALADQAWVDKHIRISDNPLGMAYPPSGWDPSVPGVWEGDTPSLLYVLNGILNHGKLDAPEEGGWGGRFQKLPGASNHWIDAPDGTQAVSKWRRAVQADFAKRAAWMIKPPE